MGGVGSNLICSVSQLPWYKFSHLGRFQATDLTLLGGESRGKARCPFPREGVSQLQHSAGSSSLPDRPGVLMTHHEQDVGDDDSIQVVGEVLMAPGLLWPCSYYWPPHPTPRPAVMGCGWKAQQSIIAGTIPGVCMIGASSDCKNSRVCWLLLSPMDGLERENEELKCINPQFE